MFSCLSALFNWTVQLVMTQERKKKKLARLARAKAKGVKKRKGKGKGKGRVKGRGKGKKRRLDDSGEPSVMRKLSFNDAAQGVPESVDGGATEPEAAASSVNPKAEVAEQTRLPTQESLEILKAIGGAWICRQSCSLFIFSPFQAFSCFSRCSWEWCCWGCCFSCGSCPSLFVKRWQSWCSSCSSLSRRCRCCSSCSSLSRRCRCCSSCSRWCCFTGRCFTWCWQSWPTRTQCAFFTRDFDNFVSTRVLHFARLHFDVTKQVLFWLIYFILCCQVNDCLRTGLFSHDSRCQLKSLQGNAHRWCASFSKKLRLSNSSKTFAKISRPGWEAALKHAHKVSWERWQKYKNDNPSCSANRFRVKFFMLILPQIDSNNKLDEISSSLSCQSGFDLSDDKIQRPGDIPQTLFDSLVPEVERLPPKKAYKKDLI